MAFYILAIFLHSIKQKWNQGTLGQSVAIFIAILGLVSLSSGFSLIVVMVLYIEREFVLYIDGFVLIVEGFGLVFLILFWCVSRPQLIYPYP